MKIDVSRRGFVGAAMGAAAMGAMGAAMAHADEVAISSLGGDSSIEGEKPLCEFTPGGGTFAEGRVEDWAGTPPEIEARGGSTMPLAELNRRRRLYVDAAEDFVKEDGTIIPAWAVKVRRVVNMYGMGMANTPADTSYDYIMQLFDERECTCYAYHMPYGQLFTAGDVVGRSNYLYTFEEATEICEHFASEGFLRRTVHDSGVMYNHVPWLQGVSEYELHEMLTDFDNWVIADSMAGTFHKLSYGYGASPYFYAMPCDKSVVEGDIYPYDDYELACMSANKFSLTPCWCRTLGAVLEGAEIPELLSPDWEGKMSPVCGHRMETCLSFGDEAEYWIHMGFGKEITKEQAMEYLHRSRDDGFILQHIFAKDMGTVCSCHGDCCGIVGEWRALGGAKDVENARAFQQISHYTLKVDFDKCVKCGTCAARCPLEAITMDGPDGQPQVTDMCFRCGQCAYVCPMEARKLVPRPEDEFCEVPYELIADFNAKAAFRFEHGMIW